MPCATSAATDTNTSLRDVNIGLTWNTKDAALDNRWWYYGKLIKGKATLVSLDLLPCLYALSSNFGDPDDYLQEYEAGTLGADAKNIYEALLREGPLHTIELKRKVNLYGDVLKAKFDKAITELQTGLKILPVGVAEAGAWRYAFIYDLMSRWLPNVLLAARELTRGEARVRLLSQHLARRDGLRDDLTNGVIEVLGAACATCAALAFPLPSSLATAARTA